MKGLAARFAFCSNRNMADNSTIEWTDATWNPVTGCTKITVGCNNCYAARFSERFRGVRGHPFESGFDLTLRPERIAQPLAWRRPRMIFVNSMSDLFHKDVPCDFIDQVFDTMEAAGWHVFQVLTKRSSLMRNYLRRRYRDVAPPAHIWLGVSVENGRAKSRIAHLREAPAAVRFLSVEPLIGPVGPIDLQGISLGYSRWRKRSRRTANARQLGPRGARPVYRSGCRLLLQTVGRVPTQVWRQVSGWTRVERAAIQYFGPGSRLNWPHDLSIISVANRHM